MKKHIENYIVRYDKVLSKDLCNKILPDYKTINWAKTSSDEFSSKDNSFDTSHDDIDMKLIVMDQFRMIIEDYIKNLKMDWFKEMNNFTNPKHDRFRVGDKMKKHCDHIHTLFSDNHEGIPILTLQAAINDNYEGGDFIFYDDKKIEIVQGDVLVFPSNFLYPYRIEKVTKGIKYNIVSWVW